MREATSREVVEDLLAAGAAADGSPPGRPPGKPLIVPRTNHALPTWRASQVRSRKGRCTGHCYGMEKEFRSPDFAGIKSTLKTPGGYSMDENMYDPKSGPFHGN